MGHFSTWCGLLDHVKATVGHAWGSRGARVELARVSLGSPAGLAAGLRRARVGSCVMNCVLATHHRKKVVGRMLCGKKKKTTTKRRVADWYWLLEMHST